MSDFVVPSASRARDLSNEVNLRLVASLRYVFGEVGKHLEIDPTATTDWLDRLAAAKRSFPVVHALFHALVAEVQAERYAAAKKLAEQLLAQPLSEPAEPRLLNLDDAHLGPDAVALFKRFAEVEEANRLDLTAAAPGDVARMAGLFTEALLMMARHDPELLGEFEALVSDVVLVGQSKDHRLTRGAVSCLEIWGALFLNPALQQNALELVGAIARECTHFLLSAYALDEPLILNPTDAHPSSLPRGEQRNMDRIYHATIVSARMVHAFRRQLASGTLPAAFVRLANHRIASSIDCFDRGVATIREHGRMSELAEIVLDEAIALVRGDAEEVRMIA
jgi:hypothetical protein